MCVDYMGEAQTDRSGRLALESFFSQTKQENFSKRHGIVRDTKNENRKRQRIRKVEDQDQMRLFTIVIWAGVTLAGAGIIIYYYATLPPCIRWEEEPYPCCTKRKSEFDCGYGLSCYEKVCVERKRVEKDNR